jgi:hypothetical protein
MPAPCNRHFIAFTRYGAQGMGVRDAFRYVIEGQGEAVTVFAGWEC